MNVVTSNIKNHNYKPNKLTNEKQTTETLLLTNINKLSNEVINIIYSYIPKTTTIFLTRQNYLCEHYFIRNYIDKTKIENYIRCMVRQDNYFVFQQLLVENHIQWGYNIKNYFYKQKIYPNYLFFIEEYCNEFEAEKCHNLIIHILQELGLRKNQHKKNIIKHII
jgi:hypothetical protein